MLGSKLLIGDSIYLSAIKREHLETFTRWFQNLDLQMYLFMHPLYPLTLQDEEQWFQHIMNDNRSYHFAICTLEDDRVIGTTGLQSIDWRNRACDFGISVGDPADWGRGYGTDATRVALRFGFFELALNRIELSVYDYNPRAVHVYENVGFVTEVTRRQAVFRDGRYHDIHIMSVLREDWRDVDVRQ